jgi:hypothetical protein
MWIPIKNKEREIVGYSVSVVVALPVSDRLVASLKISKKDREKITDLRQQLITQHFILIGNDLKELCDRLVAHIVFIEVKQL